RRPPADPAGPGRVRAGARGGAPERRLPGELAAVAPGVAHRRGARLGLGGRERRPGVRPRRPVPQRSGGRGPRAVECPYYGCRRRRGRRGRPAVRGPAGPRPGHRRAAHGAGGGRGPPPRAASGARRAGGRHRGGGPLPAAGLAGAGHGRAGVGSPAHGDRPVLRGTARRGRRACPGGYSGQAEFLMTSTKSPRTNPGTKWASTSALTLPKVVSGRSLMPSVKVARIRFLKSGRGCAATTAARSSSETAG